MGNLSEEIKIKDCEINNLKETNTSDKQKGKETVKQRKWRKTNKQKCENVNLQRKLKETERENTDLKTETTRLQENNEDFGTRQDKTAQINDTLLKCYIEQTRKTQGQTKDIDQENKSPKSSPLETAEAEWLFVNTVYSTEECLRLLEKQEHRDTLRDQITVIMHGTNGMRGIKGRRESNGCKVINDLNENARSISKLGP